jgi:hypothetical protein
VGRSTEYDANVGWHAIEHPHSWIVAITED